MDTEPRKAVRPRTYPGHPVSVRVSDDMYAQLYAIAKVLQKDISVVIRDAIAEKIIEERRKTPRVVV